MDAGNDAGNDWGQEKGTTEDEMVGWHHRLNGHGFGWTPGVGDGQGGLACCSSWGHKESDTTEQLDWTELMVVQSSEYTKNYSPYFKQVNFISCLWYLNKTGILKKKDLPTYPQHHHQKLTQRFQGSMARVSIFISTSLGVLFCFKISLSDVQLLLYQLKHWDQRDSAGWFKPKLFLGERENLGQVNYSISQSPHGKSGG